MNYDHFMIAGQAAFLFVAVVLLAGLIDGHRSLRKTPDCPPCEEITPIQRFHWACDAVLAESDGIDNDAPEVQACFMVRGK